MFELLLQRIAQELRDVISRTGLLHWNLQTMESVRRDTALKNCVHRLAVYHVLLLEYKKRLRSSRVKVRTAGQIWDGVEYEKMQQFTYTNRVAIGCEPPILGNAQCVSRHAECT